VFNCRATENREAAGGNLPAVTFRRKGLGVRRPQLRQGRGEQLKDGANQKKKPHGTAMSSFLKIMKDGWTAFNPRRIERIWGTLGRPTFRKSPTIRRNLYQYLEFRPGRNSKVVFYNLSAVNADKQSRRHVRWVNNLASATEAAGVTVVCTQLLLSTMPSGTFLPSNKKKKGGVGTDVVAPGTGYPASKTTPVSCSVA